MSRDRAELALGITATLIGAVVLLGWWVESERITHVILGAVSMKATTALCFVFCGLSCLALRVRREVPAVVLAGNAMTVMLLAGMSQLAGLAGPLAIETGVVPHSVAPGVPSVGTMASFLAIGAGVLLGVANADPWAFRVCGAAAAAFGVVGLVGYAIGAEPLRFRAEWSSAMAIHTCAGFACLGGALYLRGKEEA